MRCVIADVTYGNQRRKRHSREVWDRVYCIAEKVQRPRSGRRSPPAVGGGGLGTPAPDEWSAGREQLAQDEALGARGEALDRPPKRGDEPPKLLVFLRSTGRGIPQCRAPGPNRAMEDWKGRIHTRGESGYSRRRCGIRRQLKMAAALPAVFAGEGGAFFMPARPYNAARLPELDKRFNRLCGSACGKLPREPFVPAFGRPAVVVGDLEMKERLAAEAGPVTVVAHAELSHRERRRKRELRAADRALDRVTLFHRPVLPQRPGRFNGVDGGGGRRYDRAMRLYVWLRIVWLSLRWVGRINIGNRVRYQGRIWTVSNGVALPKWSLVRWEPQEYLEYVHEGDFQLIQSPREWWRSFQSGYRFYMGYWFAIWASGSRLMWDAPGVTRR